ncbi:hypothetical protein GCM10011351_02170 [Paraliobacillus quinghaiensis]|uniref:6-phosphogluconolactonase n=1 Tax=Paraliobacillus quinghaiensis TaxID=470815 RepID=A0A917TEJ3_9BACI|nr:lactonase family protein [Paraliobacillus quinghaiensis]GGM19864.1 hypothetical protein GCM10011351_02170 [Paraliobacillus quinghaiensis]
MGKKLTGYVGTYTKADSEGVYKFTLDLDDESITEVTPVAKLNNPTYLTVTKDNKFLYAVSKEGDNGGVTAFAIDDETGDLTKLNSKASAGSPPCHVSVTDDNTNVVTANYHTKKIKSYLINTDGSLKLVADVVEHEGSGPHERQEKPHMHFAGFTPDEKYVITIDLGSDSLTTYAVNNGELTKVHTLKTKPGSGPRHMVFHPDGKHAYVMTELTSEVIVLEYHAEDGHFTEKQYINAIPSDYNDVNDGSAIHITKDGKFVYVANRGHNSIAAYEVDQATNKLTLVESKSTEGDWPRDFVLDPSNRYLVASNQKTGTLTLFRREETTGKLTMIQAGITAPEAVCVKFLND